MLVIGDIMLDQHVMCDIVGFSPEDDLCPKLRVKNEILQLGGAGNVAANLLSLGCGDVALCGVTGEDQAGDTLNELLETFKINNLVIRDGDRCTTQKTRYLTPRGRHAVRIDQEDHNSISDQAILSIIEYVGMVKPFVVIISDYNKGVVTEELMKYLTTKTDIPIIVDPKQRNLSFYKKAFIITPNEHEANQAVRSGPLCKHIEHESEYLVITEGKNGCKLYNRKADRADHCSGRAREVGDPTGCGDSFIAGLTLSILAEMSIYEACQLACSAGACAMDHQGTHPVTNKEWVTEVAAAGHQLPSTLIAEHASSPSQDVQ